MSESARSRVSIALALVAAFALGALLQTAFGDSKAAPSVVRNALARVVRTIDAGQTGALRAGEWIVKQPSDAHRAATRGSKPVVVYLASLLKKGAPPSTPVARPTTP